MPATVSGVTGERLLEWARIADAGPFSSLGIIDRLAYDNFEPLVTLAAAAAVTGRVRLMTTVLVAPLHNTGVLAKQVATLNAISGGRLSLGVGVGGREDDFEVAPASFKDRGRRFEEQLETMRRIWSGEPIDGIGPIGPTPRRANGPELLIGGVSSTAIARVGRWADGFISGFGSMEQARRGFSLAQASWSAAGRPGKARFVGGLYFGLGQNATSRAHAHFLRFYSYMGSQASQLVAYVLTSEEDIIRAIRRCGDIGMDELVLWPTIDETEQLERLGELIERSVT